MIAAVKWSDGIQNAWNDVVAFVPRLVGFLLVLGIGYLIAKAIAKALNAISERVGFDRLPAAGHRRGDHHRGRLRDRRRTAAGAAILVIGVFAALNELLVAPAIVTGLFYALLAIIGGIVPMRERCRTSSPNTTKKNRRSNEPAKAPNSRSKPAPANDSTRPRRPGGAQHTIEQLP